jgi:hypothetical protein
MIVILSGRAHVDQFFRSVKLCATYEFKYVDDAGRVKRIYICRDPVEPLPELWKKMKEFG